MSDYTPTTEEVRHQYRAPAVSVDLTDPQRKGENFADYLSRVAGVDAFRHQQASYLAFDRWLAAHDAEVAAKAWDEGAERATEFERGWLHAVRNGETVPQRPQNPYRKAVQS